MFPLEIWEKIFQKSDATTLLCWRGVNNTWNVIITKYLQKSDSWYRQCKKYIPKYYWLMLLENSFHLTTLYQQKKINCKDNKYNYKIWITMYRAWIKWCNLQNFNVYNIDEFKPIPDHRPSEQITCCTVLGELIAAGSNEGYIRIYNLHTNQLVFRFDQYDHVLDLKLCFQGKKYEKMILIATSITNKTRVWDITSQKCLVHKSGDVICAGYGYYCTTLNSEKIFIHDTAAEDCFSSRLSIQNVNLMHLSTELNISNQSRFTKNLKYVNMIINDNQLCFWSDIGVFCEFDLREVNTSSTLYTPNVKYVGVPEKQKVIQYYLFNPYVAFCVTDRGYLGISVHKSKWKMYNVFPFLKGKITSILYYVRVLIIGLNSGDVCLFYIENELALKTIDFKTNKSKRIHISLEPIVSVNIMEVSGDQKLLIATNSTIYLVQFKTVKKLDI